MTILAKVDPLITVDNPLGIECKKCQCYKKNCGRLEVSDKNCKNTFSKTCDNAEDITDENYCKFQCGCCLDNKCYKENSPHCLIFRLSEFFTLMYCILFTVHTFILYRMYRLMFSKGNKKSGADTSNDEQRDYEVFSVPYGRKIGGTIHKCEDSLSKVPQNKVRYVENFFNDVVKQSGIAKVNIFMYVVLVILYFIINLLNILSIVELEKFPLLYVRIAWTQLVFILVFWMLVFVVFYKMNFYKECVAVVASRFETQFNSKVSVHDT